MGIAIVKPISVRKGDLGGLKAVIEYVRNENKTNGGELVFGWNCRKERAYQDMVLTKKAYGKITGRQYAHFIQSFHEKDELTPEQTYQIGREYIESLDKWRDFQVLMAVHTDKEHLHIHYIINSVNSKNGSKWQCSKQDLSHFRKKSDELCRKYNLHVIEHGKHGNKSYGEYVANHKGGSWKQRLANDISYCLSKAKTRADFLHRLDEKGIDADFGIKNVMFTIKAGVYGLGREMMCSNYKLMGYGDFSRDNILNYLKANRELLELAMGDIPLLQDALLEVGRILYPNNHAELQDRYLMNLSFADFGRMTKDEVEAYLKQKKLEQMQKKALIERDNQTRSSSLTLATIAETLDLITKYRNDYEGDYDNYEMMMFDEEDEHEL